MTEIRPFKAVHYNTNKISDISQVVCPPYDVISKEQQNRYHKMSPYNFIHVLLGKDTAKDTNDNNKYTRAQKTYQEWFNTDVVTQDESPSIYFYKQEYKVMGQRYNRLGFIALMRLQDEKDAQIFPHENTHDHAKQDRLKLWSMLKSNLSPIFVCFSDKDKKVEGIFSKSVAEDEPLINVLDDDEVRHLLWRLDDPKLIDEIVKGINGQQLFIADGHHRYEVAQEYRRIKVKGKGKNNGQPHNYVMTYFTNMDSRDLQIFPMHRIVKKITGSLDFLEEYFRIDKIKNKDDLAVMLAKAGRNEYAFGLYRKNEILLLRLKNKLLIDKFIKEGSKEYRHLDATILKHFVFDRLGIVSDDIIYTKDIDLTTRMVDEGEADAGFIMNAVKIQQLKSVALNGERMPPKTTYFYPKVLSGLTIYKME